MELTAINRFISIAIQTGPSRFYGYFFNQISNAMGPGKRLVLDFAQYFSLLPS